MIYLLDTNIVSDGGKQSPNQNVAEKIDLLYKSCAVASVSLYEILKGVKQLPVGKRKLFLEKYCEEQIVSLYDILPYDKKCAEIQSNIFVTLKEKGQPALYQDTQIAAIALANDLILVTRNVKDFSAIQEHFPLKIENWFEN